MYSKSSLHVSAIILHPLNANLQPHITDFTNTGVLKSLN